MKPQFDRPFRLLDCAIMAKRGPPSFILLLNSLAMRRSSLPPWYRIKSRACWLSLAAPRPRWCTQSYSMKPLGPLPQNLTGILSNLRGRICYRYRSVSSLTSLGNLSGLLTLSVSVGTDESLVILIPFSILDITSRSIP